MVGGLALARPRRGRVINLCSRFGVCNLEFWEGDWDRVSAV